RRYRRSTACGRGWAERGARARLQDHRWRSEEPGNQALAAVLPHFRSADVVTAVQVKWLRRICRRVRRKAMIRDVMVWLDGGVSDEIRLAAVADISRRLDSQVVIGLFLNPLPLPVAVDGDLAGAVATADLLDRARELGDKTEALLAKRRSE